jgi:hypothetical protein
VKQFLHIKNATLYYRLKSQNIKLILQQGATQATQLNVVLSAK